MMKTLSVLFLLGLFFAGPLRAENTKVATNAAPVPQVSLQEKYCKNIDNEMLCNLLIEKGQLQEIRVASKGKALPVSRVLKLKLKNGSDKLLEDTPDKTFAFREYMSTAGYFLVNMLTSNNSSYLMISDSSGKEQNLSGLPVFSASKQKLVTASYDLTAGNSPNTIQVWRVTPTELVREMALEPEPINWGPSDVKWLDEKTVQFTKNTLTEDNYPACALKQIQLKQTDKGWRILEV
jgi:hypothetical protein